MSSRIVITIDSLRPGDMVDAMLRERGLEPIDSPAKGTRTPEEKLALFAGASAAIAACLETSTLCRRTGAHLRASVRHPFFDGASSDLWPGLPRRS